jgi:hypothetical protein
MMITHHDIAAPPAGITSVSAARQAFLPPRTVFTVAPVLFLARLATAFDHRGHSARTS